MLLLNPTKMTKWGIVGVFAFYDETAAVRSEKNMLLIAQFLMEMQNLIPRQIAHY